MEATCSSEKSVGFQWTNVVILQRINSFKMDPFFAVYKLNAFCLGGEYKVK
jgi:hypothetical protein